jgi:hypothetical protein
MALQQSKITRSKTIGHSYDLDCIRIAKQLSVLVLLVFGVLLLMGILNRSGKLPNDAQLGDPDATIISAKARLATQSVQQKIAFIGDSSCLVNIHIPTMLENGIDAVNLGTLSYLGIDSFGLLAQRFCQGKTDPNIVLVLHPECLRMVESSSIHRAMLLAALGQKEDHPAPFGLDEIRQITIDEFKSRMVDGWLPSPLKGRLGYRYGFTHSLRDSIMSSGGFMEETSVFDKKVSHGSSEYRVARRIQDECMKFRSYLPKGARVRLLISPVPASHASRAHAATVLDMGKQVETWLRADGPLLMLPSVMPDSEFGTITHLLPKSAREYTRQLCGIGLN